MGFNTERVKLKSICEIKYGKDHKKLVDGSIPAYGSGGLMRYVDKSIHNKKSVLIPRKGTLSNLFLVEPPFWTVDTLFWTDINTQKIHPDFLYYQLCTMDLASRNVGTAVPSLTTALLNELEIILPSMKIQERIVSTLAVLDAKIETNQKINDNLQQQAAALFATLYDRAETEVGFTEIIQILGGGTPKTGESSYWNGNIPFFTPKDVGVPYTLATEKTITEEGLAHCNSRLYPVNTVFVTARGTVGKVGIAGIPMAMNQSCYALVGKDVHQLLVYFYTLKAVDRLKHKASGAVFDAITTKDFETECICKLSDTDSKAFLDMAETIYQTILGNANENQRLSALRDALLPKLMSGEIDVSNIEI